MATTLRISTRNAQFQQWQAMLTNRTKRQRAGELLVQGVRPITLARQHGWSFRALIVPDGRQLSGWARQVLDEVPAVRVWMAPELVAELGGKDDETPELVAVVELPADDLTRLPAGHGSLTLVLDRLTAPGNIGTLVRSADAFGATGVVVTGHAADPYDPRAVRASTGSLFAVPVVRVGSHRDVLDWVGSVRSGGTDLQVVGTDEDGTVDVADHDLRGPRVLVIGNETHGLSAAWREACDDVVRIPIAGAASSLNASAAGAVVLYEAARQRGVGRA